MVGTGDRGDIPSRDNTELGCRLVSSPASRLCALYPHGSLWEPLQDARFLPVPAAGDDSTVLPTPLGARLTLHSLSTLHLLHT